MKPVRPIARKVPRMTACSVLLNADAVRALDIAADDRPDTNCEHGAGEVADERVRLVGRAAQKLQALGHLVIYFKHGGDAHQH